jgi:hypothetical protein
MPSPRTALATLTPSPGRSRLSRPTSTPLTGSASGSSSCSTTIATATGGPASRHLERAGIMAGHHHQLELAADGPAIEHALSFRPRPVELVEGILDVVAHPNRHPSGPLRSATTAPDGAGRLISLVAPLHVLSAHPQWREPAGLETADDAHVRPGPLRGPPVEFSFAAVFPLDVHGDRDGRLVVGDVVAHELPTEGVWRVFDRISLHSHSVEHLFESGNGRDPIASPPTARLPRSSAHQLALP